MWTPPYNVMPDEDLRPMVTDVGSAELITVGSDGFPVATRLPVIWREDRLHFHLAVANPQWQEITDGAPALAVVTGPEAYMSPSWYVAKQETGRVVPTWNYSSIHFRGRVRTFRDEHRLRTTVTELTDLHESLREHPWSVSDAPKTFIDQQLKAIVGIEFEIESILARAKRSQNRPLEDREQIIRGLEQGTLQERALASQMAADLAGSAPA